MHVTFNGVINPTELNELLATVGWDVENLDFLEDGLNRSWGWLTLRDDDEKLTGFVQLLSEGNQKVTIYRFLIQKKYHGQGYGTQLFKSLLEILKEEQVALVPPMDGENEGFAGYFEQAQRSGRKSLFMGN